MNLYTMRIKFLLAGLLLASVLYPADWSMFRGNPQRTGFVAENFGVPGERSAWTDSLGCPIVSSPAVSNGVLYVGGRDSCVYAITAATGELLWKKKTGDWVDASPLIFENKVIVGSRDGSIYVFDRSTGADIGVLDGGMQISSPVIANGKLISGLGPPLGGLAAYDLSTTSWLHLRPEWIVPTGSFTYSSPAIQNNVAVLGSSDGRLYAIDLTTHTALWSTVTNGGVYLSVPAILDSVVYFSPGNYDSCVYAVWINDGTIAWKSHDRTNLSKKLSATATIKPQLVDALLKLSPLDRSTVIKNLRAKGIFVPQILEAGPGLAKKSSAAAINDFYSDGEAKTSSVAVDSRRVYVVRRETGYPLSRLTLLALDNYTGEELWRFSELRDAEHLGFCSSPVITNNQVFCAWGEGKIYAFKPDNGQKLWETTVNGNILSSPVIAEKKLYVATMTGYLYAYNLNETPDGINFQTSTFCYPNPARGNVSHIQLFVPKPGTVDVTVYNSAEKPVFRISQQLGAGDKSSCDWDLSRVANGVYFALVKVQYADGTGDKKVLKVAVLK
jgi:eukaryotic-like serine/threonine-protein kinase